MELEKIGFRYGREWVLEDVSLRIKSGACVAITGANGAGKSTLLKLMAGILKPSRGKVMPPRRVSYLPQLSSLRRDFPLTVGQVAATGLWPSVRDHRPIKAARQDLLKQALHEVGLTEMRDTLLSELSGGQFQRLLLARVLLENAATILLDEPFSAIDAEGRLMLLQLLERWRAEARTVLCVLHDGALVASHFDCRVHISERRVKIEGPSYNV